MLLSCPLELRHHTPTLGASCSTLESCGTIPLPSELLYLLYP